MKKEITYKQLINFANAAGAYLETAPDNKLKTSVKSVLKQINKDEMLEDYNAELSELQVLSASVDIKGNLIKEGAGYAYTPEGMKKLEQGAKALRAKTVTIHTRIDPANDELATDLAFAIQNAFEGIVINEETTKD